jgi:hypothetical protein
MMYADIGCMLLCSIPLLRAYLYLVLVITINYLGNFVMRNLLPLVRDYKHNVPLHMLEAKYSISIHKIIDILHTLATRRKSEN